MARVGHADFYHSTNNPTQRDTFWLQSLNKEYWDHAYHALNESAPDLSRRTVLSASREAQRKPWAILNGSFRTGIDDGGGNHLGDRQFQTLRMDWRPPVDLSPAARSPLGVIGAQRVLRASASSGALPLGDKVVTIRGGKLAAGEPLGAGRTMGGGPSMRRDAGHRRRGTSADSDVSGASAAFSARSAARHQAGAKGAGFCQARSGERAGRIGPERMPSFNRVLNT